MKKERRLLALILCLCMLFSMVPAGAAELPAAEQPPQESQNMPETPKESPEQAEGEEKEPDAPAVLPEDSEGAPSESNDLLEEEITPFSTTVPAQDKWEQDGQTIMGTGSICEMDNGVLHIKAGSGNGNGKTEKDWPAAFINKTASDQLKEVDVQESRFIQMDITPISSKANSRFGLFINYATPGKAFMVGYDTNGWFWEDLAFAPD